MGSAASTSTPLDEQATLKICAALGANTRATVAAALRARRLDTRTLLNTSPRDLAALGFSGHALKDAMATIEDIRQEKNKIDDERRRAREEAARAEAERREQERQELEKIERARRERADPWLSNRGAVHAIEQLVYNNRHVLNRHPQATFQLAVAQTDPRYTRDGSDTLFAAPHLFRTCDRSNALNHAAHLRPCVGGGREWKRRVDAHVNPRCSVAVDANSGDAERERAEAVCRPPLRCAWPVRCIAIAQDPTIGCVVTGGGSEDVGEVAVWDVQHGQLVHMLPKLTQLELDGVLEVEGVIQHRGAVNCVALTPDASVAASGADDGVVLVWNVGTGRCTCRLSGHPAPVVTLALSGDGCAAVSGAAIVPSTEPHGARSVMTAAEIKLWEVHKPSGVALQQRSSYAPASPTLGYNNFSRTLSSASDFGGPGACASAWPEGSFDVAARGLCRTTAHLPAFSDSDPKLVCVAMAQHGTWLIAGTSHVLSMYDADGLVSSIQWREHCVHSGHKKGAKSPAEETLCALCISSDKEGSLVATGHGCSSCNQPGGFGRGVVRLWERGSWTCLRLFEHTNPVHSVCFSSPCGNASAREVSGLAQRVFSASRCEVCVWCPRSGGNVVWHQLTSGFTASSPHDSPRVEQECTSCLAVSEGGLVAIGTSCEQSIQAAETFDVKANRVFTQGRVIVACLDEPTQVLE